MSRRIFLCPSFNLNRHRHFSTQNAPPETIIFAGIEPNGPMHIGNYYGVFKNCITLQNSGCTVHCSVGDMLSIALPTSSPPLQESILLTTACLIGCGLNPEKSTIFLQSQISQLTQLCWVLGCLTDLSELPKNQKDIPIGAYLRSLLQTADILLHKSSHVCIGYEKLFQLPLVYNLAKKFNERYAETFHHPVPIINAATNIKDLRQPSLKMSKSANTDKGKLNLTDSPDVMLSKIRKAVTDCTSEVTYAPETRPGVSNLVAIHCAVTAKTPEEVCEEASGLNTDMYKTRVAEILIESVKPIHVKINDLLKDKAYLASVLDQGTKKASDFAAQTWIPIYEKIGSRVRE